MSAPERCALLSLCDVTKRFGGTIAVEGVSLEWKEAGVYALIGPNGCGKTTVFNLSSGFLRPDRGRVVLDSTVDVARTRPHRSARHGIVRLFQDVSVFDDLSVADNLVFAASRAWHVGFLAQFLWPTGARRPLPDHTLGTLQEILGRSASDIRDLLTRMAGDLSFGEKRAVAVAMVLSRAGRLALLDEPFAGLSPVARQSVVSLLRSMFCERSSDVAVVIDHDWPCIAALTRDAATVTALDRGKVVATDTYGSVTAMQAVSGSFLGSARDVGVAREAELGGSAVTSRSDRAGALLLQVRGLRSGYGDQDVVAGVSLDVHEKEIVALIGLNGSGKSTVLRTLWGLAPLRSGVVTLRDTVNRGPGRVCWPETSCSYMPQGTNVYADLSVLENLRLAATRYGNRKAVRGMVGAILDEPWSECLRERISVRAGQLSKGQQQVLALARALVGRPALVLLDEPALGMDAENTARLLQTVQRVRDSMGTGFLLVEQRAAEAMAVADWCYMMARGEVLLSDSPPRLLLGRTLDELFRLLTGSHARRNE